MSDHLQASVETMADRSIGDYLDMIASAAPTPGGGSVAGVVAAMAAGLVEMVCRLTIARAAGEEGDSSLHRSLATVETLRSEFLNLAAADEQVYRAYRDARALPRTTDQEVEERKRALTEALVNAADVPLKTAQCCLDLLQASESAAAYGTIHALSDVRCAAQLSYAAGIAALMNVEVNAALMKDRSHATELLRHSTSIRQELDRQFGTIQAIADSRTR